jgi:hypothetical protein
MSMGIHPSAVPFDDRFNHRANSKRSFQVHFNSCKKRPPEIGKAVEENSYFWACAKPSKKTEVFLLEFGLFVFS